MKNLNGMFCNFGNPNNIRMQTRNSSRATNNEDMQYKKSCCQDNSMGSDTGRDSHLEGLWECKMSRDREAIRYGNGTIFLLSGMVETCVIENMQNYIAKEVGFVLDGMGNGSIAFLLPPQKLCTLALMNQSQAPVFVKQYVSPNLCDRKEILRENEVISSKEMEVYPVAIFMKFIILELSGLPGAYIKVYSQGLK